MLLYMLLTPPLIISITNSSTIPHRVKLTDEGKARLLPSLIIVETKGGSRELSFDFDAALGLLGLHF